MSQVLSALQRHATHHPDKPAIRAFRDGALSQVGYGQLWHEVEQAAGQLKHLGANRIALRAENGLAWAIADLAATRAGVVLVPVPLFFTQSQCDHLLESAGIQWLWGAWPASQATSQTVAGLTLTPREAGPLPALHADTVRITFTSGSTGRPKGVCLSHQQLDRVSQSLAAMLQAASLPLRHHLALLPLSTLLENLSGLYVPILLGLCTTLVAGEQVGLIGASQLEGATLARALLQFQPNSLVVTPALLEALMQLTDAHPAIAESLHYVAVGGARVPSRLMAEARQRGLPIYQGYGLSECASVVAVQRPGSRDPDGCGAPLPHCQVTLADDGEILVSGNAMLGYLGEAPQVGPVHTGDLGTLSASGTLAIVGRKKNLLITRFGRNVSPEWLEAEALAIAPIRSLIVLSDPSDQLVGLLHGTQASDAAIREALAHLNAQLPDYARLHRCVVSPAPLYRDTTLFTDNGRPRRAALTQHFAPELSELASRSHPDPIDILRRPQSDGATPRRASMDHTERFFAQLQARTTADRAGMLQAPIFRHCAEGTLSPDAYTAFLVQAYHHVKHTVPLLMACGGRLGEKYEWMRAALAEYIEEEQGHHEWILNDLTACGVDPIPVRENRDYGRVSAEIELMVAYLYHQIDRGNPMALFGMVWVLEGTSVSVGGTVASQIQQSLGLPDRAMTYLRSHSELDQDHIKLFASLMDQVTDPADQQAVVEGAQMVFRLYGGMLHNLGNERSHQAA